MSQKDGMLLRHHTFTIKMPGKLLQWMSSVGMKMQLRDLKCEPERADEIGALAVKSSPWLSAYPTPIDVKVASDIYRDAFWIEYKVPNL